MNKRVLFVCCDSDTAYSFRRELIAFLKSKDCVVDIVCGDDDRKEEIMQFGITNYYNFHFTSRNKNPFQLLRIVRNIKDVIKETNPDCVLSFFAKANVAASKAMKKLHRNEFYPFVEGLGSTFKNKTLKQKLLKLLMSNMYKNCFKVAKKVVLLNSDDKKYLIDSYILKEDKAFVIPGIGINCDAYVPTKFISPSKDVLMISRLLFDKGILDYCKIARRVHSVRKDINFYLYGKEAELTINDLKDYISDGSIIYGGFTKDIENKINISRIVCLPSSYGEGYPRSIMEAMCLKRVVIGYDNVGTRDAIQDGETGYLIEKGNVEAFAQKILEIIDNDNLLEEIGNNARQYCFSTIDSGIINGTIYKLIFNL